MINYQYILIQPYFTADKKIRLTHGNQQKILIELVCLYFYLSKQLGEGKSNLSI